MKSEGEMVELDLARYVRDLARQFGWLHVHFRPLRDRHGRWQTPYSGDGGFPDVVLARHGDVILAELKMRGHKPRADQELWLEALGTHGRIWQPRDMDAIAQLLSGGRGRLA